MAETSSPVRSLEARFYTDPEVFRNERDGLLARTWQFACHGSKVENPGDYCTFEICGESLVCVRGRDGIIRSYFNVCQHRGHRLVAGRGNRSKFVCPYHAWTYELTGELRTGPNVGSVHGFDRTRIRLSEVRCEEFHGFVFVNLDSSAAPMDEWFPDVRSELEEWVPNVRSLKPLQWFEIPERCNWKVSVENYSECYHCALNHPTFSKGVVRPETYDIQPQGYCLRHTTESQNVDSMTYDRRSELAHMDSYSSWFLWPTFSFQVYPGSLLNTYHWRPLDVENVVVWRGWYSVDGQEDSTVRRLASQDRETTVAEDIRLVECVQLGLGSRGYVPGPLVVDPECGVNSEHSLMAFQQWVREAVDGT